MQFSVVIPLYNKAAEITRSIKSVQAQVFTDWELLIVDDGSTDGSQDAVKPYLSDPRIIYCHQDNQGVSVARNIGTEMARSNYICFLDADDAWAPSVLTEFEWLIRTWPGAAIYSVGAHFVSSPCSSFKRPEVNADLNCGPLEDFFAAYGRHRGLLNSSSVCVERVRMLSIGGFPAGVRVGEDIFTWIRLAQEQGGVVVSNKRLATVYRDDVGIRATQRLQAQVPYHLDYYLERGGLSTIPNAARKSAKGFLLHSALLHAAGAALAGDRDFARRCVSLVWKHSVVYSLLVILISRIPHTVLRAAKKWRNDH